MPRRKHRRPFYQTRPFIAQTPDTMELWIRDRVAGLTSEIAVRVIARGRPAEGEFELELLGPHITVVSAADGSVKLHVKQPGLKNPLDAAGGGITVLSREADGVEMLVTAPAPGPRR